MITIVTITYNNFSELKATLQSLKPLEKIFEILVINGGQCSDTLQYLKERNYQHISEADQGISDAFNKGIAHAQQPFIWYINSGDVLLNPDYGLKAIEHLKNDQSLDYIYGNVFFQHVYLGKMKVTPSMDRGDMPFPHPSLIMRRSLFERIGKFDIQKKVAMDYEIAYKLITEGYKGLYLNTEPVVLMDGTGISSKSGLRGLQERRQILKKIGILNWQVRLKFFILECKSKVRQALDKLGLLEFYDAYKKRKFEAQ